MNAEALSQEQIDALMRGQPLEEDTSSSGVAPAEREAIDTFARCFAEASTKSFSILLGNDTRVEPIQTSEVDSASVSTYLSGSNVCASVKYTSGIKGSVLSFFPDKDVITMSVIATGEPESETLSDIGVDFFREAISTCMGQTNVSLGGEFKTELVSGMPEIEVTVIGSEEFKKFAAIIGKRAILIEYSLTIADAGETSFVQVLPNGIIGSLMQLHKSAPEEVPDYAGIGIAPQMAVEETPKKAKSAKQPAKAQPTPQPVSFEPLVSDHTTAEPSNLDIIMDIGLLLRVELGRTHMRIKDVLQLGPGSVIELDKLAGEPVDILVNEKLFAKGEVVVIEENFGVRVTDILNIPERIEKLK